MSKHTVAYYALAAIGIAAGYYLLKAMTSGQDAPATARGVTASAKSGSLVTTPVELSKVAAVAIENPLDWIGSVGNRAADVITANLSNGSAAVDWRVPFGNPESRDAASSSTKATNVSNYRPAVWAGINFRSGV
jgi:hypothetical protein